GPVQHGGEAVDAGEFGAEHLLVDVVLQEHGDELVGVGAQEVHDPLEVDPQGDGPADQGAAVVAEDRTVRGLMDVQHETADAVGELAFDAPGLVGEEVDEGRGEAAVDAVGVGVVGGEEGDLVQGAAVRGRHRGGDGPGRGEVPGGEVVRPGADGERGRVDGAGGLGGDGEAVAGARGGEGEAVGAHRGDGPGRVGRRARDGAGPVAAPAEAGAGGVGALQEVGAAVGPQPPLLAVLVAAGSVLLDRAAAV